MVSEGEELGTFHVRQSGHDDSINCTSQPPFERRTTELVATWGGAGRGLEVSF